MDIRATRKLNGQPSRARIACLHCRSRKVRCTLAIKGPPCTNCQLDGLECVTCPKLRKRSIHTSLAEDVITSTPIQEENATQRYDICTTEKVQDDALKSFDLNGMNIFKRQRTASGGHEARLIEAALSVDSYYHRPSMPNRDVFFSFYSFLQAPNLRSLQSADRSFLEAQECLHVPTGPILEAVMSRYFLYVHPCLPVINEAEFWPMLNQDTAGKSSFSLLVFQAMMFAACSYISLADAQKWGAESILEMRNSFYRRAKFLYNFGVEDDRLCIAQALTLLTYQSTGTDHLSNTTWLGLAIQQAQLINAHLYHRCPVEARYKRSELKRLWWCLIIRDRIVSLGMRRPLQILPTHFDVASRDPLLMDDLSDEIHTSRVYDPETKEMLCKIMTSLCRLAVSLTNVIMTLYPLDPFPDGQVGGQSADIASIDDIQSRLHYWAATHMLRPSPEDADCHTSVAFFKQLNALYFESARLALYQYISFRIHRNQRPDDWPDLMDAVTAIHDVVKRFVIDGTACHLPISAVAYTALPQMVLNLNLRLSSDTITRRRQENVLSIYMELNRQYVLRYDVSHVSTWVNRIVRLFEVSLSPIKPQLSDLARRQRVFPGKDCLYLLELEPELYFKISGMMDASMSTGQLALEYFGTRLGFPSQDLSLSFFRGDSSDFPAVKSPGGHSPGLPERGQILPLDENSLEGEDEDPYMMDLTSIELLSRGLGLFGE